MKSSTRNARLLRATVSAAVAGLTLTGSVALTGCGGGSGGNAANAVSDGGGATISLQWPERGGDSRLVPAAANSVRVAFLDAQGQAVQSQLLTRPQPTASLVTTARFVDLPGGALTVQATAFPNADGTGVAQAQAAQAITITPGQSTPVPMTMGTTIASVTLSPNPFPVLAAGESVVVTASALDAQGNLVLSNTWTWNSTDPTIITVQPNGAQATLTNVAKGTGSSTVSAIESESGKGAAIQITIAQAP